MQPLKKRATGAELGGLGGEAQVELCDREFRGGGYPPGVPHKWMGRVDELGVEGWKGSLLPTRLGLAHSHSSFI